MDHPLTSSFQGLGIVIALLLSPFYSFSQAQVISGLTAYQSGTAVVLELANISSVSIGSLSFYYSRDGGSSWELINDNCLSPVSSRSVEWAVLECLGVETFAGDDFRFKASASSCSGTVRFDVYDYRIVEIGDQCWFAENLRTTTYANGEAIPGDLNSSKWKAINQGAQADYENDALNLSKVGRLYNWFAVNDSRGLCPSGWHVPTDNEWMTLEMQLGMTVSEANSTGWRGSDEGALLKSSESDSPSWNGANSYGFSALPAGLREGDKGYFDSQGHRGYWWSSSPYLKSLVWCRQLNSVSGNIRRDHYNQRYGFSVRCLRNE